MPSRPACLVLGLGLGALIYGPLFEVIEAYILNRPPPLLDPNS